MDSSFCKYSQKIIANWFFCRSFMIDKRERFVFWIRESQTNNISTSSTNVLAFFSKEGTEEHDFHEAFDHYSVEVFLNHWIWPSMNKRSSFQEIIPAICVNLLVLWWVLFVLSNHLSQLQSTSKYILNFLWLSLTFSFPSASDIPIRSSIHHVMF